MGSILWGGSKYIFTLSDYKDLYKDKDSVVIKVVLVSGKTIYFNIKVSDNNKIATAFADYFALTGIPIVQNKNIGTMILTGSDLEQSILLPPDMEDCEYSLTRFDYDAFTQTGSPKIENNTLTFTLKDNYCSAEIQIDVKCYCEGKFTLYLYNLSPVEAKSRLCTGGSRIEVTNVASEITNVIGDGCLNLRTKWLDPDGNVIEGSSDSNILDVTEAGIAGTYTLVYYHPDDTDKPIYTFEVEIKSGDIYPSLLTLNSSEARIVDKTCYLTATIELADEAFDNLVNNNYKLVDSVGRPLNFKLDLTDSTIVIDEQVACLDGGEYIVTFQNSDTTMVCNLVIPYDCECTVCDELEGQLLTGYYGSDSIYKPRTTAGKRENPLIVSPGPLVLPGVIFH